MGRSGKSPRWCAGFATMRRPAIECSSGPEFPMNDDPETYFPSSPVEMASWVRDRSVRVVHELSEVIWMLRHHSQISDDVQSDLHLSLSAALANALKLMSFAAG